MNLEKFAERNRKFLEKMQKLPNEKKKIILWIIVAILALPMGFFWIKGSIENFSKIGDSVKLINFPKIDTSSFTQMTSSDVLQTTTPTNK